MLFPSCDNNNREADLTPAADSAEIQLKARLIDSSTAPALEDIFPYEEALTVNEYQVLTVTGGPHPKSDKIRIAQWAITNKTILPNPIKQGEERSIRMKPFASFPELNAVYLRNDLTFDPREQLYYDLTPLPDTYAPPRIVRYDYHGDISKHMQVYWLIRDQIKLVAVGNSHTGAAVDTRRFYQPGNNKLPVTLGLTPAGSGYRFQCLLADQYLASLPRLKWVIWGVSPRIFNKHFAIDPQASRFTSSPGFRYDQKHWKELTNPETSHTPLSAQQVNDRLNFSYQIWERKRKRTSTFSNPLTADSRQKILQQCDRRNFEWNEEAWKQFENSVKNLAQENIQVLLFIPPYHPLVTETRAVDEDGTGKADYEKIVGKISELSTSLEGVHFVDTHKGGQHGIEHEHFTDVGHLYQTGTLILTDKLVKIVEQHNNPPRP